MFSTGKDKKKGPKILHKSPIKRAQEEFSFTVQVKTKLMRSMVLASREQAVVQSLVRWDEKRLKKSNKNKL